MFYSKNLKKIKNVNHCFFSRKGGFSKGLYKSLNCGRGSNDNRKNINKNTKGIVVTHLFGYPCEMDKIKEISQKNNLVLIEDCAQSFGTFYKKVETGNFGDVGIYSCSLIKIPTTLGGGILITSDKSLNDFINNWIEENIKFSFKKNFSLIIKNILSIANSFPFLYSILASKVFFFLNKFNPRIYRKIRKEIK